MDKVIAYAQSVSENIDNKIENAEDVEKHTEEMIEYIEKSKKEIEQKKSELLTPLLDQSEEYKKKIADSQKAILDKVMHNRKEIEDSITQGKKASVKFKEFFERKSKIEKMLNELDIEKSEIELGGALKVDLTAEEALKQYEGLLAKLAEQE